MSVGVNSTGSIPSLSECNPGLRMLEFNVLVLPEDVEKKSKGGIILVDETRDADQHSKNIGRLVSVSPSAFSYDDAIKPHVPQPGAIVLFAKYGGTVVEGKDGRKYRVLKDSDIAAVVED